jgi:hypothetical protein
LSLCSLPDQESLLYRCSLLCSYVKSELFRALRPGTLSFGATVMPEMIDQTIRESAIEFAVEHQKKAEFNRF